MNGLYCRPKYPGAIPEGLVQLEGDGLDADPVHQGVPDNLPDLDLHGLPDGLCGKGMMQTLARPL